MEEWEEEKHYPQDFVLAYKVSFDRSSDAIMLGRYIEGHLQGQKEVWKSNACCHCKPTY